MLDDNLSAVLITLQAHRKYDREISDDADIMTVGEWDQAVEQGAFGPDDGLGYWVKDGKESQDEVFCGPSLDATHVAWYNK